MITSMWRRRLYRPEALRLIARDLGGRQGPVHAASAHLEAAAEWILRAQSATPDDGVSGGYSFEDGWIASYPETTGYIIPTLLAYAAYSGRGELQERALAMAAWECTVQLPNGGFPGHFVDRSNPPVVFNTGQVIFGLLAAHNAGGEGRFVDAARRAAAWLVAVQERDGSWRRFDYRDTVHVYNTRTAWALVELGLATGDAAARAAGERHLDWALSQQDQDGWFRNAAFGPGEDPFLHTIAYTTQGLLEAGLRLDRPDYVTAAERACRALLPHVAPDGFIAGTFAPGWRPTARYSCLTGNAQMAAQWLRLHERTGDPSFRGAAERALTLLKRTQDCAAANPSVRGAIKGSHPIWGRYLFGTYPNWAAKFFMDALLMEELVVAGRKSCIRCW
jgi:uncharacterized protein YyaL (SSP411 family)